MTLLVTCLCLQLLRWKSVICSMFQVWFSYDLTQFDRMFFCRRFPSICHFALFVISSKIAHTSPFGGIVTQHLCRKNLEASPRASWLASVSTDPMVPARLQECTCLKLWTKEIPYTCIYIIYIYIYIYNYIYIYIWGLRQTIINYQPESSLQLDHAGSINSG